jgi:hypothetical protein
MYKDYNVFACRRKERLEHKNGASYSQLLGTGIGKHLITEETNLLTLRYNKRAGVK